MSYRDRPDHRSQADHSMYDDVQDDRLSRDDRRHQSFESTRFSQQHQGKDWDEPSNTASLSRDGSKRRFPSDDRSRSPHRSHSHERQPPSKTLVLDNLPPRATKQDIKYELENAYDASNISDVRLIIDHNTGRSRRFAFVQFRHLNDAQAFVAAHGPTISFGNNSDLSDQFDVSISYSKDSRDAREERPKPGDSRDDWTCEMCAVINFATRAFCYRCSTLKPLVDPGHQGQNMSSFSGFLTTGDSDVSPDGTPSQFLIVKGLETSVTEELLAKGVAKLYKDALEASTGPRPKNGGIVAKPKDSSVGAKEGSIRRIMLVRDRSTEDSWRYGFAEFDTVENASLALAKFNASTKFTIASKPVTVHYIHAGVFVPVLQAPSAQYERFTFSPQHNPATKLMYWDEAGYVSVLNIDNRSALDRARESINAKMAAAAKEGLVSEAESKTKKRKAEKDEALPSSKKVIAPHLQFWSNRHAELHGLPPKERQDKDSNVRQIPDDENTPPSRSYADLKRMCCYLCRRQFGTEAAVHKHDRLSQMHLDNMTNDVLVAKAIARLAKAGLEPPATEDTNSAAYRDRARERRQAFNQPKQPAPQQHKIHESTTSKAAEATAPVVSKGAALLGKMGWTAGSGLGAEGTGRTEAITTELYAQGVGLGAQGGKMGDAVEEANKSTRSDYRDFVLKSKEKAKERYQNM